MGLRARCVQIKFKNDPRSSISSRGTRFKLIPRSNLVPALQNIPTSIYIPPRSGKKVGNRSKRGEVVRANVPRDVAEISGTSANAAAVYCFNSLVNKFPSRFCAENDVTAYIIVIASG